ncbi:MAG TPA: TetR/AcrR family transcriptional regulator [Dongiaceae bacterium]|nr:TetR/AcrR family transcriptional regulator [Dongiaceae bacterium]
MAPSRHTSAPAEPNAPASFPSRRERRSAELRERVFRSALQLFGSKGYAETTVEDITAAADVGKGTFFNYFPSKEHVLISFSQMQLKKLETVIGELRACGLPLQECLHRMAQRMTELPIQNPGVVRALLQAHTSSPLVREEMFRVHHEQRRLVGSLLALGQERGEVRRDMAAEDLAQIMRQMIFGTLLFWSLVGDASLTARVQQALHLLWGGMAAPNSQGPAGSAGEKR